MTIKPVSRDGIAYPSQSALGAALGVSRATVSKAIQRNRLDRLGTGSTSGRLGCQRPGLWNPVSALGHHWPSQRHCAAELGVSDKTVHSALQRGRFDALVAKHLERLA